MNFSVELINDQISVEAGSTTPLSLTLKNAGDQTDQFEVQIEGVDAEWVAIPVPVMTVDASATLSEKLFFKPPRTSESLAGAYPFVLKVRSLTTGESRSMQGILTIAPFHYLSMEMSPKRGVVSPTRRENNFQATFMNLGNTEHSLQLFGNDPEDALTFAFSQDHVTVGPGQTKIIEVTTTPVRSKPLANPRLHGFQVGGRSIEVPSVACSSQAQLEQRAYITPGMTALAAFLLILFIGWFALLPKPPKVEWLRLNQAEVFKGDSVTVSWETSNSNKIELIIDGEVLQDAVSPDGEIKLPPLDSDVIITLVAVRDDKRSVAVTRQVRVLERPESPTADIQEFTISPKTVNRGEMLTLKYKVNEATVKLTLLPTGELLDPSLGTKQIVASSVGTVEYELVAENADRKTTRKTVRVTVNDPTLPKINEFKSSAASLDTPGSTVTISWNVLNAVNVELNDGSQTIAIDQLVGTREYVLEKTTTFTLTITDNQGRTETKTIKVEVKSEIPTIDPASGGGTPVTPPSGDNR